MHKLDRWGGEASSYTTETLTTTFQNKHAFRNKRNIQQGHICDVNSPSNSCLWCPQEVLLVTGYTLLS